MELFNYFKITSKVSVSSTYHTKKIKLFLSRKSSTAIAGTFITDYKLKWYEVVKARLEGVDIYLLLLLCSWLAINTPLWEILR